MLDSHASKDQGTDMHFDIYGRKDWRWDFSMNISKKLPKIHIVEYNNSKIDSAEAQIYSMYVIYPLSINNFYS
jgi:hypothetical protein